MPRCSGQDRPTTLVARTPKSVVLAQDDGGPWTNVVPRLCQHRALGRVALHYCEARPVLPDLVGWCFNCFSIDHMAMVCHSRPWCFCCNDEGYRACNSWHRVTGRMARGRLCRKKSFSQHCGRFGGATAAPILLRWHGVGSFPLDRTLRLPSIEVCRRGALCCRLGLARLLHLLGRSPGVQVWSCACASSIGLRR